MDEILSFSFLKERNRKELIKRTPMRTPKRLERSKSSRVSSLRSAVEHRFGLAMHDTPMTEDQRRLSSSIEHTVTLTSAIDPSQLITVAERDALRARYHIFISHAQTEASGDVGTLFFLFEQMGVHGWRDMNQTDLTEEGMRRGVYDSDVFILFLTNSYLSRKFCLAEIMYALEFGKPIIIVTEEESRFWEFDLERWRTNCCTRIDPDLQSEEEKLKHRGWTQGKLQTTYETCPDCIKQLIEDRAANGSMLPFRRRNFEVDALTREIVRRASVFPSVQWGAVLPPPAALVKLDASLQRKVFICAFETEYTLGAMRQCKASIDVFAPGTVWVDDISSASHALVILSKGCVNAGTRSEARIAEGVGLGKKLTFLYVAASKESESWDFGDFYALHNKAPSIATGAVGTHEALKYRDAGPAGIRYEHDAMILEILQRMRVVVRK